MNPEDFQRVLAAFEACEVLSEEGKGLGERAPAGHDLGASVRDQVERREVLEDPHRVVGGKDGDGAGQPDPLGPRGRRGEDRGR